MPWKLNHVHYWSDGAASQFKNKFNFDNLLHHKLDFDCTADWSFFATAHGKGPVDGIGGEVKRQVWRSVLQGKEVVTCAQDFVLVASKLCHKITIMYQSSENITADTDHLTNRWEICTPLPGTHSYHYIKPINNHTLAFGKNSIFTCPSIVLQSKVMCAQNAGQEEAFNLRQGDFVTICLAARCGSRTYVAQVMAYENEELDVCFLRATGYSKKVFVYPAKADNAVVLMKEVIVKLPTPSMDKRGRYIFDNEINVTQ